MAYNFSEAENKTLEFWKRENIFEKTLEKTKDKKPFVFYDGPPFATGTPHYGHLLQSVIKDAIPRYKTMRGFYVARQWGWDCHGLPIENIVEKELGTKSKKEILAMGVKKFNDLCRERIFTFIEEWERVIPRFGRWADMDHPYKTMDFEYMQSEWWAFKELHGKGLIYEDYRSMHICPRCETTLSQGEVADGYKDIKDLSVTVKMKVRNPEKYNLKEDIFLLAWTTTPWTLPGNVALAVGEKISYVHVLFEGQDYVVAKDRAEDVFGHEQYQVMGEFTGKDLVGIEYEPLFDYYAKDENLKNRENGWKVYAADFVTTDKGTGIAHEAPAFGAEDWMLLKQVGLPFVQHVKMDGTLKPENGQFAGLDLKPRAKDKPEEIREADLTVVKYLEEKGLVFSHGKYEHSYPHCWRCDTALLNYATSSWFVAVEKIKPTLLKTAKKINWSPEHIKEGRFGQWLEGARDWSISRQRFWANTIPVWRCGACKKQLVFGSADELEKASGTKVTDLHKEVVDEVIFPCDCGAEMQRVPEVLDTWFDSGSVPFAILHYPVEHKNEFKDRFPADFIGEAQDQTRAWFYYQHVLAGALFESEAFKNCIVTGIVLAEDGKKMSKKLKNYPDPMAMIEKYGADAMRFYILSSPVVQGESLYFSEKGLDEIAKKNLGRLQNVLAFYQLYENGTKADAKSKNVLDRWILMRLQELLEASTRGYEKYNLYDATRPLTDFIDDLSVWYLRRSRDRFKEESEDKKAALATMRYVLGGLSKIMAPSMPFFGETLFGAVSEEQDEESVHLASWPEIKRHEDTGLKDAMVEVRKAVTLALAERSAKAIKVRQPLGLLTIKSKTLDVKNNGELLDLIKDEVNVKEIAFDDTIEGEIKLDVTITPELKEEGAIRDIVRFVQDQRKEEGLKPEDKISLSIQADDTLAGVIKKHEALLLKEVRAKEIIFTQEGLEGKELAIDNQKLSLSIKKV
ncbi:isoleucine--tRNA ligase [Candidatus Parcubacteria bacterium]|nr:isoleucine--tRNA ligase [Candidatus Parcubacteria bacterium]